MKRRCRSAMSKYFVSPVSAPACATIAVPMNTESLKLLW